MSVRVENLSYRVKGKEILSNVSFSLECGHITLFVGKSGSGKTTLLRTLVGLAKPSEGKIFMDKESSPALVFQQPELFPHMTVLENCVHPQVHVKKVSPQEAKDSAYELLITLGIENLGDSYPSQLSGGQKQRVAIVRSLCMGKRTLLFDEPTSALDPFSTAAFKSLLEELKAQDLAIGISTHDIPFVQSSLDRIYLIEQGKIVGAYDSCEGALHREHPIFQYLEAARLLH
ncbi:ATP-binding cassette domain-containing protein [Chlamydia pecorum]|uniref:ATP-binding cassette domain-containing protein n=1 Tax=Chlamydia pecorum TaxID=85991 RepID=UPI0003AE6061|nr:ATP-binding cassette domain-containing protein [Chlamydia pecorum]AGW39904.1 amino acid ABC transporter, ATP-binding protein [Chlamydia pecorum P787]